MRLNELMTTHFITGRGEGGSSGFAVTYLTFCQNFAVGSAEEVWFRCLFFYTLKVTLLMREFLAALVSIITFFFSDNFACMILFCFSRTSPSLF